jgi:hypothetical protein
MKTPWITLLLLMGLIPNTFAKEKPQQSSSNTVRPQPLTYGYLPGVSLVMGSGFSLPTEDADNASSAKMVCFQGVKALANPNRYISQEMQLTGKLVTSNHDLDVALGIDSELDASYLVFSGSGKYDFNISDQIHDDDLNLVIQGYADYSPDQIDPSSIQLAPFAQQMIDKGQIDDFKGTCGTQFVSQLRYGTSVSLIITISHVSEDIKESLSAQVSASGSIGLVSGSAKTSLNQLLTSASASTNVSFKAVVQGGDGVPNVDLLVGALLTPGQDVDHIVAGIQKLFNTMTPEKSAVIGFVTTPYPGIPWSNEDLMSDHKGEMLSRIVENYRYENSRFLKVQNLYDQIDRTDDLPSVLTDIPATVVQSARGDMDSLGAYVIQLAQAHANCMKDQTSTLSGCNLPPMPPLPYFNRFWQFLSQS